MGGTRNKLRPASEALLAALLAVGCFGDDTTSAGSGAGGAVGREGTTSGGVSGSVGAAGTAGTSGTGGTSDTGGTTLDAGEPCVIGTEPKPTSLPFAVDQFFTASGWMQALLIHQDTSCAYPPSGGDAGSPAVEAGTDASLADVGASPTRVPLPGSHCWTITYTPATPSDWAGVDWQFPANNWGTSDGLVIPPGATTVSFVAWGDVGGERVSFNVGYGPSSNDHFGASLSDRFLTTTPTAYAIDITGIAYTCSSVRMGFGWISAGGATMTFHVADIRWE